jgi:type II secretory pathway component GspD/PulD (secretin)
MAAVSTACHTATPVPIPVVEHHGEWIVVPLMHAECTEIADLLNDLIRRGRSQATTGGWCAVGPPPAWPPSAAIIDADTPQFLADPATNSLLIRMCEEDTPNWLELVGLLDHHATPVSIRSRN